MGAENHKSSAPYPICFFYKSPAKSPRKTKMASKRKKAEKKKDFAKSKLRVGKTPQKPDNYTDTSFTSKSIALPSQSLAKKTGKNGLLTANKDVDLTHHLSLTRHHALATRKEVLAYIEAHLPSNPSVYKQLVAATVPMVTDESQGVRTALVSLLEAAALNQPGLLDLHLRQIALYIHSAMSHIQPDIRNTSLRFLALLLRHSGRALVKGHFVKTLKSFFTLLGWTLADDRRLVSLAVSTSSSLGGASKKARVGHVAVLRQLLQTALFPDDNTAAETALEDVKMVHAQLYKYLVPTVAQPFAALRLFTRELATSKAQTSIDGRFAAADIDAISTDDLDTRRKVVKDVFLDLMVKNLQNLVREGGEVGREASTTVALLERLQKDPTNQI